MAPNYFIMKIYFIINLMIFIWYHKHWYFFIYNWSKLRYKTWHCVRIECFSGRKEYVRDIALLMQRYYCPQQLKQKGWAIEDTGDGETILSIRSRRKRTRCVVALLPISWSSAIKHAKESQCTKLQIFNGAVRPIVSAADKLAKADLLWEKNIMPRLISQADKTLYLQRVREQAQYSFTSCSNHTWTWSQLDPKCDLNAQYSFTGWQNTVSPLDLNAYVNESSSSGT
jgi:hypothetical protein